MTSRIERHLITILFVNITMNSAAEITFVRDLYQAFPFSIFPRSHTITLV